MAKIKICGLFRPCDVDYVNEAKPDYAGFVFAKSRRQVTVEQARRLREKLLPGILPVGVFVNAPMEEMVRLLGEGIIELAQLHGQESAQTIAALRKQTGKPVIKAVRAESRESIRQAQALSADYLLLDHGAGGTGQVFDWSLAQETQSPFFLAGGLHHENIEEAIRRVNPFAVDLSSGAETDGVKDRFKILEIVRRVRNV